MTIPSAPQIGSTGLVQQPGILQQILPVLEAVSQHKLANAQIESYQGLTAERRAAAAEAARKTQDAADAAKAFYAHLSGSAQRLKPADPNKPGDHQGVDEASGMLIPLPQYERTQTPGAHAAYMHLIAEHNAAVQQTLEGVKTRIASQHEQAQAALTSAQAAAAEAQNATNTAVGDVLARYAGKLGDPQQQARALADVAAIDPQQAEGLGRAFNVGSGRYHSLLGPNGYIYMVDTKNGTSKLSQFAGMKPAVNQEAIQRAAATVRDLFDEQTRLIRMGGLGASKNPSLAAVAESARFLGISTEGFANLLRDDPQQVTRMLRTRFAHNYIALLPHSRSAAGLLQNLTESYWAPAGSSPATLAQAERDRRQLRTLMDAVAKGQLSDLSRLPGFAEAANAAVSEGQIGPTGAPGGQTTAPNPSDWLQGTPPP